MGTWLKIACRNVGKNRRRSTFTIIAIGLGFAAVNVFGGFTAYIFTSLMDGYIYAQGNGHLTIFKKGFNTDAKRDYERDLITADERQAITDILRDLPEVLVVTGQLYISGLLSDGDTSTIFIATGRIPSDMQEIKRHARGMVKRLSAFTGQPLEDDTLYGVGMSSGLAARLELTLGSEAIVMAPTIDGQINALDVKIFQLFDSPIEGLNNKFMDVPLGLAQSLYNTTSVDRLTVMLQDTHQTEPIKIALTQLFSQRGLDVDIYTWQELSLLYVRVKKMFDIIFLFLFVIVFIIVVMSIINTISMAVMERTTEIGTLRALGLKRYGIVRLFALESAMLGLLGSLLGVGLTFICWLVVEMLNISWIPPTITVRLPLEIYIVVLYLVSSAVFLVILSIGAAIFPARRAAYRGIVEALGHA